MNKYDIETHVMTYIKKHLDKNIADAIRNINLKGFNFIKVDNEICIFRDDKKNLELDIISTLGVSCTENNKKPVKSNVEEKEIEERFYRKAEEGTVKEINILSSFEADIYNGGFEQLYLNKGLIFIEEAIAVLNTIGSKNKLRLSKEAYGIFFKYSTLIKQYSEYQKSIDKLDEQYYKSKENIPLIYHKKMVSNESFNL